MLPNKAARRPLQSHEAALLRICHARRVGVNTRAGTIARNSNIVHLPYSQSTNEHTGRYNCTKQYYCAFAILAESESTRGPLQLCERALLLICHARRVGINTRAVTIARNSIIAHLPYSQSCKKGDFRIARRFNMPRREDKVATP